jgi:hypothetical protein
MKMIKTPFSKSFRTTQTKTVSANSDAVIFHGDIPDGATGFLGVLSSNDYEGVVWSWYIDDECVEENIQHALGDMQKPEILNPPYVVKKYVEVKARNTLQIPVILETYCDGVCYKQEVAVKPMLPMPSATMVLQEIRDEMKSKNAAGEVTDELINVTDVVQDVYDQQLHGLHWTVCDVVNRGPNNVYLAVNEWKQPVAPLLPGEAQNIDLGKRASIKRIYFKCDPGETAQVRLHAMK